MSRNKFAAAPIQLADVLEWGRRNAQVINQLLRGQSNNLFQVTLAAGVTTTTITNSRITADTAIFLTPRTANAAAALATTYAVSTTGSITITHANLGTTDRTFDYVLVG